MKKLINICDDPYSLNKFDNSTNVIETLLKDNNLDGLELIRWNQVEENVIPKSKVKGVHLSFWPTWLDFWKTNKEELIRQFDDEKTYTQYYNAKSIEEFTQNYRKELIYADKIGAEYVVFHVSHVELEHCFNNNYTYNDEEIVDAFIKMLNIILKDINIKITILFENHWYPGLTFLNKKLVEKLIKSIEYPHVGFVLDIGHLMNSNIYLKSEEDAVEYILDILENLGELRKHIKTIHLNSSLTGEYVTQSLKNNIYDDTENFNDRFIKTMKHVCSIDTHKPFTHPSINKILSLINPEFLVYELSTNSLDELNKAVELQNSIIV